MEEDLPEFLLVGFTEGAVHYGQQLETANRETQGQQEDDLSGIRALGFDSPHWQQSRESG